MSTVGEARTRIILIVDLVGSTTYRVEHGDNLADNLLMLFEQRFEQTVIDFDGRVVANHGDGFLSSFSSATNALAAAVAFRSALAELPIDTPLPEIRAGIAAGDVIERGREMYGLPIVVAARLERVAESGEILCADVVRSLAGSRSPVLFEAERTLALKGLPGEISAWTVVGSTGRSASLISAAAANKALPTAPNRFFGRDRELDEIAELLQPRSVTTLIGPGGVGKTRLSLELARKNQERFADGVWFVPLESATMTEEIVATIGRAMHLPSSALDGTPERLSDALAGVDAMIVLDNCEQAVRPIGEVVNCMLEGDSRLALMCSSRESLHVPAEVVWTLDPLTYPRADDPADDLSDNDAVAMFVDRARSVDASQRFTERQVKHIAEVVRRLEGLPLAIELAASRLNVFSTAEMAAKTSELFELLSENAGYRPDRHSAIQATVEWSVSLLSDAERHVLFGAAVFVGGFTFDSIEAVCADLDAPLVDVLSSLVSKSLIRKVGDRFSMLLSIRETLLVREDAVKRVREARLAMLDFYERLAHESDTLVQPSPEWLSRFNDDHGNFAHALEIATTTDKTRALRLAGQLALSWVLTGRSRQGDRLFTAVLESAEEVDPVVKANALRGAAMAAGLGANYRRSQAFIDEACRIYENLDRPHPIAYCRYWSARNIVVQCHFGLLDVAELDAAHDMLKDAMATFRSTEDVVGELLAFPYLGWARLLQGKPDEAVLHTEEMLALADTFGATLVEAYARAHAGFVGLSIGSLDEAAENMRTAFEGLEGSGDMQNLVIMSCVDTSLQSLLDDQPAAETAALRMLGYAHSCDSSEWECLVVAMAAHVLARKGEWDVATQLVTLNERLHPTWRVGLRNTGIDPAAMLEHVSGAGADSTSTLTYPGAIRLARRSLGGS